MKAKKKLSEYEYVARAGQRATVISALVCAVLSAVASMEYDAGLTWLLITNVAIVLFVRLTARESASYSFLGYRRHMEEKERQEEFDK